MHKFLSVLFIAVLSITMSCTENKLALPVVPDIGDQVSKLNKTFYNLVNPILDDEHGYEFRQPSDIYVGADNFVYVCNTGMNRIEMLDLGGTVQGVSQYIEHPEAISQNDSLQLLIVNKTNRVFRIDLPAVNHNISEAPIDTVFEQASQPTRQFTGISVHNHFEYFVTVIDVADTNKNYVEFSFIYDFYGNHTWKGWLPLEVNGTALNSVILPTAILSLRERYLDRSRENTIEYMFTHRGQTSLLTNAFKFQHITTRLFEGLPVHTPNTSFLGKQIYTKVNYYNLEDLAIDRQGNIFLLEAGRHENDPLYEESPPGFFRFPATGDTLLQSVTGFGSEAAKFNNPKGIAVLPEIEEQIVYVADTGNNRVMMFQLSR